MSDQIFLETQSNTKKQSNSVFFYFQAFTQHSFILGPPSTRLRSQAATRYLADKEMGVTPSLADKEMVATPSLADPPYLTLPFSPLRSASTTPSSPQVKF